MITFQKVTPVTRAVRHLIEIRTDGKRDAYSRLKYQQAKDIIDNSFIFGKAKRIVLERDKAICQLCGKKNSNFVIRIRSILYEPVKAASPENMISACLTCQKVAAKLQELQENLSWTRAVS